MKTALVHILCGICAFLMTTSLCGQTAYGIEEKLNRYELLCKECLELRTLAENQGSISRETASQKIGDFLSMNKAIKADFENMTSGQQTRFRMISYWFSTRQRPLAMDHVNGLTKISPEIRRNAESDSGPSGISNPVITYRPDQKIGLRTYIMADISFPVSYGILIGLQKLRSEKKRYTGGYAHVRSNFRYIKEEYSCTSSGNLVNGQPFWGNGNSRRSDLMITGGLLTDISSRTAIYAGAGYGFHCYHWQDIDRSWALVKDRSHKGAALETGLIASLHPFCFGLGVSTISFRTSSLDLIFGIRF